MELFRILVMVNFALLSLVAELVMDCSWRVDVCITRINNCLSARFGELKGNFATQSTSILSVIIPCLFVAVAHV